MASIYTFKDGKLMYKNKIAYANGDFVSLKDYEALENKVQKLKCELDKTYNQLMEVEKDAQEQIAELEKTRSDWVDNAVAWKEKFEKAEKEIKELESKLEVKENLLKIKNGLCESFECLPSEPVSVANMLINAKEEYEPTSLEKALCSNIKPLVDKYSIDDLEQIAEHLLVYCKHNKESEE